MPEAPYPTERKRLEDIAHRIVVLRMMLMSNPEPAVNAPPNEWFEFLSEMKRIQGNTDNGLAFITTMMARDFLVRRLPIAPFDVGAKPQGAKGLDIDVETEQGERVVAEIKATVPYKRTRLGAQQDDAWRKDFDKLNREVAEHKFFFVTDPNAFDIVRQIYAPEIPGVVAVLLTTGEKFVCPEPAAQTH